MTLDEILADVGNSQRPVWVDDAVIRPLLLELRSARAVVDAARGYHKTRTDLRTVLRCEIVQESETPVYDALRAMLDSESALADALATHVATLAEIAAPGDKP